VNGYWKGNPRGGVYPVGYNRAFGRRQPTVADLRARDSGAKKCVMVCIR